jgi:modulator of FtsH protease
VRDVAYHLGPWSDFFVAAAGASAALAGLVFVAVSINVESILKFAGLPERGLTTVLLFASVLVVSLFGLTPGQTTDAFAIEILALGVAAIGFMAPRALKSKATDDEPSHVSTALGIVLFAIVPLLIAGISLLAGTGGGMYWVLAAFVTTIVGSVANAWVLLVEIRR